MLLYKVKDFKELSRKAANIISAQVILKPTSVLGLATGSTPVGTYKQLIEWYEKGDIDFSQVTTINLDEYKGLGAADVQSYRYFMNDNLFNHVNVNKDRTFVPNGLTEDPEEACKAYDDLIAACGGIDLQLLGIGGNGHIGFNEPTDSYIKATHVVTLSENTRSANAASLPLWMKFRHMPLPWGSAVSWKPKRSSCLPVVRQRHRRSTMPSTDRSRHRFRLPSCNSTRM